MDRFLVSAAMLFGVGKIPVAPGTAGTIAAVPFVWLLLKLQWPIYVAMCVIVIALGVIASDKAETALNAKDPGAVVIDEFAGYMVTMAFLPAKPGYLIAGFALFRAFDILKPPPIGRLQKLKGGWGVMIDDIAAGIIANLILQAWMRLAARHLGW